jgi:hypothetical protein
LPSRWRSCGGDRKRPFSNGTLIFSFSQGRDLAFAPMK